MPKKGHVGTSLGGAEFSPDRKKRDAEQRKRQEKYWASRSGEVRVSKIEPVDSVEETVGEPEG
jgi:hypothetical protein